jgi:hypothetical protein
MGPFCVCFHGWFKAKTFLGAWRTAGIRPVGHLVFQKRYASATRFLRYQHEQAYLLAKGELRRPGQPIPDVLDRCYPGEPHPSHPRIGHCADASY